jgi:hypothetical protein
VSEEVEVMSKLLRRRSVLCASLVLLAGLSAGAAGAQDPCAGSKRLLRLAGRSTMFHGPVQNTAEVQALFRERRGEIETLLRQVGFAGNPQDLFDAVAAESSFDEERVAQGTRMGWMFFRRRAQPTAMTDICWAAPEAFDAYVVEFDSPAPTATSGGTRYRIAVPKVCGNLALLGQEPLQRSAPPPPPPPVCALDVTDSCDTLQFDIDATGTTARDVSIAIEGPESRRLGAGDATAPLRWRYANPQREASFRFTLTGRTEGAPQCTDSVSIDRDCCPEGPPSITLTASSDRVRVGEEVQVQAQPSVHECAQLRGVTIDGVEVAPPYARNLSWTDPGEYTVVARVTDDEGQSAEASVTIRVTSPRGWTLRAFAAGVRFDDDVTRRSAFNEQAGYLEQYNYLWESGWGLGVEGEYRFNDTLGLAGGLFLAEFDTELMFDTPFSWEMDFDTLSTRSLFVGPMFHPLRRDGRLDFFVGPIVHFTQIGDLHYDLPSRDVREEFDDELSYGAQLGLDIGLARDGRLGLHVGGLWLDLDGDAESAFEDESGEGEDLYQVSISPLSLNVGLFYRFR